MLALWEKLLAAVQKEKSPLGFPPNRALLEATDTVIRKPAIVTKRQPHIRDATDTKRFMFIVVVALFPALAFGTWNVGNNAYMSIGIKDASLLQCLMEGAAYVLPLVLIVYLVGGAWEGLFAQLRGHEVSEGFLVTGMLMPLVIPPTLPWWQLVLGVSFGVVIGKEVFGGVGMNVLNPALAGRAFLFFAYPAQMSGDVWVAKPFHMVGEKLMPYWQSTISTDKIQSFLEGARQAVDGYSGATPLSYAAANVPGTNSLEVLHKVYSVHDMVVGTIPGSIGETSLIAILIGAVILIGTGIGSWRTMVSVFVGGFGMAGLLYAMTSNDPSVPDFFKMAPWEHLILGGFAFGAVFMATDPVSSPFHKTSKVIYGLLIGILCVIIRTINPAYPEGMMLAILFMNVFAPLIDYYVVGAALKRRSAHAK